MEANRNRWLIAASAVAIHVSIGSVYAYSVYQNPLNDSLGWEITDVTLAFTIAIFFLGLSAAFMGKFVEKHGPKTSSIIAAIFFGIGTIGSGLAVQIENYALFLIFYGVIGGIGLGIGYISPVSTLVKWFPDRRGMATGMAVMGFGAGALITSPTAEMLMTAMNIPMTFYILGAIYFILMISGGLYLQRPPEGWQPKNMPDVNDESSIVKQDLAQLTANEAVKTPRFYLLWFMMFINVSAGIMLLSVASNMTQSITGATAATAAGIVGIIGLFNGLGRIGWSSGSDYLGRTNTYITFFVIQIIAFFLLPLTTNVILFSILLYVIITCYGGGFACLPAYIGDLFGTKELGAIHGYLLTSWALAGVAGPSAVAYIVDTTQSYTLSFYLFNILLIVAFVLSLIMRSSIKKTRQATHTGQLETVKA